MSRIAPLSPQATPELKETFEQYRRSFGFIPNSLLIMQRRPKVVRALAQLSAAVWDPQSTVDLGFKRLLAHVASRAHGCQYCMAHTAGMARKLGVSDEKLAAVWEYRSSPLYSVAERVALDFALAGASVPNGVTDELFAEMLQHWDEGQMVEIVAVISIFGFMNRWNDTMATPLETEPVEVGERFLAAHGWSAARHVA
jgi:uncharacterized peroxidase-related enzyme